MFVLIDYYSGAVKPHLVASNHPFREKNRGKDIVNVDFVTTKKPHSIEKRE